MKQRFCGWQEVARLLADTVRDAEQLEKGGAATWLNAGQRAGLLGIADRLQSNGVIIADEVGMGKTRIASAVTSAVVRAGGRVAVLVPPGLGFQWRTELRVAGVHVPPLLRSVLQYLDAWSATAEAGPRPWFEQPVVVMSHAFANWRLGEKNSDPRRWALLPALYGEWRKNGGRRYPRNFRLQGHLPGVAARSIVEAANAAHDDLPRQWLNRLVEDTPWPGAMDPTAYGRERALRRPLEEAVGLGLGTFDLVIIDEAHKSRGGESVLSGLLERIVVGTASVRRLAMTATPVELDVGQWKDVLHRIAVDATPIFDAIDDYAVTIRRVRETPLHEPTREAFKSAAARFQHTLSPYLIRRDKREDPHVQAFARHAMQPLHGYRRELEISVDTTGLSPAWKQAVCAAEALSAVTEHAASPRLKRLRVTLGSGHGIAALLRPIARDVKEDHPEGHAEHQVGVDEDEEAGLAPKSTIPDANAVDIMSHGDAEAANKRIQRADWWMKALAEAFIGDNEPLYDHPGLLAAIEEIEATTFLGEKVLVFGRFTRPMEALVDLLNARAMLRNLDKGAPWPRAKVPESDWPAVRAAHRHLGRTGNLIPSELDAALARQYNTLRHHRESFRERLLEQLEEGLREQGPATPVALLFGAFKSAVTGTTAPTARAEGGIPADGGTESHELEGGEDEHSPLAVVAKALQDLLGEREMPPAPSDLAAAFTELIAASMDRDRPEVDGGEELDEAGAAAMWETLAERWSEEFGRPQGGFARLMNGGTRPDTRRFLQTAFNRKHSFPRVLVAQSMVGREGLNLHKACRTVVMLHPEWNPGVAEQQIGRVDRVGSRWQEQLDQAIADGLAPNLPRIDIRPIVFKGTYDEKNWEVLRDRWSDLRAQLHGVVISLEAASNSMVPKELVDEINNAAPNFSPLS
ncbi:type III restriction endonuclease subunit R [Cupriavidus respiraculi]|uniref:helicase-related protein n=1 Tax=Cupriavidus respiraculi TaxID=195930 RepID=UPI001C980F05|nr:helicase-related protein [Cupriavidus respiraculi]MBY4949495.1 type III restriction endonuclease subunit R [Cupriavidus respiraculi]